MDTKITVTGGEISQHEIDAYIDHLRRKHPRRVFESVEIKLDGEYVELSWRLSPVGFDRIRRITGYLVGTVDRFNDAKRMEVGDRVKHGMGAADER